MRSLGWVPYETLRSVLDGNTITPQIQAALAAAGEEPTTDATTPRKRGDRRPKADEAATDGASGEDSAEA